MFDYILEMNAALNEITINPVVAGAIIVAVICAISILKTIIKNDEKTEYED